ncbi:hypothetical protein QWY96_02850 [Vibrio artabrorum]|uniref:Uncharacterized protein n=1 Tax=Vibrio artabrorum TaxID=446374 RepID=A0ABT8CEF2_9VIBR|nr:hypothetical protein [Vibrio artabrorum]MDN3700102.1 hypothetical protein [Vibrio artabrorum]
MTYNGVIYHLVDYQKSHVKTRIDNFWKTLAAPNVFAPFIKDIDDASVVKKVSGFNLLLVYLPVALSLIRHRG